MLARSGKLFKLFIVQMIVLDNWRPDRTYESLACQREQINRAREQAWKNTLSVGLSPEVIMIIYYLIYAVYISGSGWTETY